MREYVERYLDKLGKAIMELAQEPITCANAKTMTHYLETYDKVSRMVRDEDFS